MASTSEAAAGRRRVAARGASRLATTGLLALACIAPWPAAWAQQACDGTQASLATARFKDNGDGTVTDTTSQLMWMRCAGGQQWQGKRCVGAPLAYEWAAAGLQAEKLNRDGSAFFNDWRLPSLRELASITDRGCRNPRTNVAVFPDAPPVAFWSSTPRPGEAAGERVLALSFGDEGVMLARKDERLHLRLVRTGP